MLIDIKEVQQRLVKLGYNPGLVDGRGGPLTRGAVTKFQGDHHPPLTIDGDAGVQTMALLRKLTDVSPIRPAQSLMSQEALLKCFPKGKPEILIAFDTIKDEVAAAGLTTTARCAHFLSQVAAETGYMTTLEENLHYSAKRLREVFPSRVTSDVQAEQLAAGGAEAIANFLYGGRYGNKLPGDGFKYRGGGFLQTTFFANYDAIGHANDPETVRTPVGGLRAALNYWVSHGCNAIADGDTGSNSHAVAAAIRKVINGGTNGLDEVLLVLPKYKAILAAAAPIAPAALASAPLPAALKGPAVMPYTTPSTRGAGRLVLWIIGAIVLAAILWWLAASFTSKAAAQAVVTSVAPSGGFYWSSVLSNIIEPLVVTFVIPAIGVWAAALFQKWTGHKTDDSMRASLQAALTNAAGLGARWLGDTIGTTKFEIGNPIVDALVNYVINAAPDALVHFNIVPSSAISSAQKGAGALLSDDVRQTIATKIESKLPQLAAAAGPLAGAILPTVLGGMGPLGQVLGGFASELLPGGQPAT
jgi:putative chitinase